VSPLANNSKILVNDLYADVEKSLSNSTTLNKYQSMIGSFIDRNHETLSDIGPNKIILFTDKEKDQLFELTNVSKDRVKKAKTTVTKTANNIKLGNIASDTFRLLMGVVVRFFSLKKNEKLLRISVFYLACSMYPSLFTKYWKYTPPNDKVMQYTINHLSNKYKIKQLGSVMAAIDDIAYGAYLLHKDGIDDGTDYSIVQFILAIQTRLNSFFKQLSNEWYANYKSGKYMDNEFESNDEDSFREAESSTHVINRIVDNVSMKLVIQGPPMKIVTIAANNNKVSVNELRNYLNLMIVNDNISEIKAIVESILMLYLYNEHNSSKEINSDKFLIYCLDTYKRSNTTDPNVINIKKILDKWLERLDIYKKTQRVATINDFRRALFVFFVMTIQYYNN
jgi:hypothetical protein